MREKVLLTIILLLGITQPVMAEKYLHFDYTLGGEERFRYEYRNNFDFNNSQKDNGSLFFNRAKINLKTSLIDANKKTWMDLFVEGVDTQAGAYRIKAIASQQDAFDLHQGYVTLYNLGGVPVDIKAGRQELNYGKGRVISAPAWLNILRAFDAAIVHIHPDQFYADLIYGQLLKTFPKDFDRSSDEEELGGVYAGYQKTSASPLWEGYFLTQIVSSTSTTTKRYTVGPRLKINLPKDTALDVEAPYQFGEIGTTQIRAYAFHADLSKTLKTITWSPQMALSYDEASGDKDPNDSTSNSFVPVYGASHEPFGILDFFRWQNIRNPEFNVTFSPTQKFRFRPQVDFFWLQSKNDAWYNSAGTVIRNQASGDRSDYVGSETSLRFYYDLTKNLRLESGYAHFFSGGYVRDTGADDGTNWVYSQFTLKY